MGVDMGFVSPRFSYKYMIGVSSRVAIYNCGDPSFFGKLHSPKVAVRVSTLREALNPEEFLTCLAAHFSVRYYHTRMPDL